MNALCSFSGVKAEQDCRQLIPSTGINPVDGLHTDPQPCERYLFLKYCSSVLSSGYRFFNVS
jgi:hypothetical protein